MKPKRNYISKERAIHIAANHNCVSIEVASNYTLSELKEILKQLKIKLTIRETQK